MKISTFLPFFLCTLLIASLSGLAQECSIVVPFQIDRKVEYGLGKLESALKEKGILSARTVLANNAPKPHTIFLQNDLDFISGYPDMESPPILEAFAISKSSRNDEHRVGLFGHDDQGLMYALLEVAQRISWGTKESPFQYVEETIEKPEMANRGISMYTMHRQVWEKKLFDQKYWKKYFDMLAQNRFNSFEIIFGYETGGFLAPTYPYFFDVPEFPEVKMVGLSQEDQKRNLDALNHVIELAHDRGIKVTLGIWEHIYRGGVQAAGVAGPEDAPDKPTEGLIWGVTGENLIPYTKAAVSQLIKHIPNVDGIEFRMHNESGLRNSEQEAFWKDVFKSVKAAAPHVNYVFRAKDMPESVVQAALDEGINFRIETKYWMEQMGMPWHPTHINKQNQQERRHGYADMLRYPQDYKMYWRLWTGGTTRILTWGSPEFAQRFINSAKLYHSDSYEVNEPLATKMETMPHHEEPFELLSPEYRYYEYEFERYWHFFQVFGRLGYNFNTSPDIWHKEFEKRFGKAAPVVEQAIHEASWILPRVVASNYPYGAFPTTRGWPEKQALGTLPQFAKAEGSDIQIFASFAEEAKLLLEGGETAKLLPSINSLWFKERSEKVKALVAEAEGSIGQNINNEFKVTMIDLKILANLALYHSRRIPAAVSYQLFLQTEDAAYLDDAIKYEKEAIEAWKQIIVSAGDVYSKTLNFGIESSFFDGLTHHQRGHWIDELGYLETGLAALEKKRSELPAPTGEKAVPKYQEAVRSDNATLFNVKLDVVQNAPADQPMTIKADVSGINDIKWVKLRYRPMNQKLEYAELLMTRKAGTDTYEAVVPAEQINRRFDFMYFIEVMDSEGNGKIYPDMNVQTPYIVVELDREQE